MLLFYTCPDTPEITVAACVGHVYKAQRLKGIILPFTLILILYTCPDTPEMICTVCVGHIYNVYASKSKLQGNKQQ